LTDGSVPPPDDPRDADLVVIGRPVVAVLVRLVLLRMVTLLVTAVPFLSLLGITR